MIKFSTRSAVAGIALAVGLTGAAQAESLNIWSASQAETAKVETVRHGGHHHRHYRHGINPGLAAIGIIGGIAAGAAIASERDRYYRDEYYDDGYYDRRAPRRYSDCDAPRPKHYPAPPGC